MAIINLTFGTNTINTSVQVGDTIYSCEPSATGQFNFENSMDGISKLGTVSTNAAGGSTIQVDTGSLNFTLPTAGAFILFSKDNQANLSSLVGYYAEAKFVNNSKTKAELFSISATLSESSK